MKPFYRASKIFDVERNVIVSLCFTCIFRALRSISENGGWENLPNNVYDDAEAVEEYKDLEAEYRRNGNEYFDNNVHMDDCEVFECSVATFGRKVIGAVRKFGDR